MLDSDLFPFAEGILHDYVGSAVHVSSIEMLGGGCINQTFKVTASDTDYFLKWNENDDHFFDHEVRGLQLLQDARAIKLPEVIASGVRERRSFLLLEYIAPGYSNSEFWDQFGSQLALLHQRTSDNGQFGLDHDNEIGRLGQKNEWKSGWIDFFIHNRLEIQLTLAYYNELIDQSFMHRFRQIYDPLHSLLLEGVPALIHGDLWSGNYLTGEGSVPVLIDPAVYYGNREVEIAYTQLFGGFDRQFYRSYHEAWPLEAGFQDRVDLYNLYPLLVHVNHFGRSYLSGIEQTLRRFL